MLPLLLMSALTQAREPDRIHGFRIGSCVGFSTECIAANIKLEYAGKYAGINLSLPGIPAWGAASLRVYPIPVRERPSMSWRPYGYGGVSMIIMAVGFMGGGVGADLHLTPSRRLCLQPSAGVMTDHTAAVYPSAALGAMYTF